MALCGAGQRHLGQRAIAVGGVAVALALALGGGPARRARRGDDQAGTHDRGQRRPRRRRRRCRDATNAARRSATAGADARLHDAQQLEDGQVAEPQRADEHRRRAATSSGEVLTMHADDEAERRRGRSGRASTPAARSIHRRPRPSRSRACTAVPTRSTPPSRSRRSRRARARSRRRSAMPVPTALFTGDDSPGSDTSRPASHRTSCTSSTSTPDADDDGPTEAVHGAATVGGQDDAGGRRRRRHRRCATEHDGGGDVLPLPEAVVVEPVGDVGEAVGQAAARLRSGLGTARKLHRARDDGDRVRQVQAGAAGLRPRAAPVGPLDRGVEDRPEGVGVDAGLDGQLERRAGSSRPAGCRPAPAARSASTPSRGAPSRSRAARRRGR